MVKYMIKKLYKYTDIYMIYITNVWNMGYVT